VWAFTDRPLRHLGSSARSDDVLDELRSEDIDSFFNRPLDLSKRRLRMSCAPLAHPRQHVFQQLLPPWHHFFLVHLSAALTNDD